MDTVDLYCKAFHDPAVVNGIQYVFTWTLIQKTSRGSWLRIANIGALTAWMIWIYLPGNPLSDVDFTDNVLNRTLKGCIPLPLVMRTAAALLFLDGTDNQDMATATRLTVDPRAVSTPWQVKGILPFPAYYASRPPSRGAFIVRQAAIFVWQYIAHDLVFFLLVAWSDQMEHPAHPRDIPVDMWPPGPKGRSVVTMVMLQLIGQLGFDMVYRGTSIVFVLLGVPTSNFPPLFGSIWDAYNLKNWWGKCWHQFMRMPFSSTSSMITRQVLRLPRSSAVEGYLNIMLAFIFSGLTHYLGARAANIPYPGAMHFFCLSGVVVLIEVTVQALYYRFVAPEHRTSDTPVWQKLVGIAWVVICFYYLVPWYTPEWEYLFTMGSPQSLVGELTKTLGVPGACAVVGVSGLVVKWLFETSL